MDKRDHNVIAFVAGAYSFMAINPDMVSENELKSYQDLLNPKWKGKILFFDPTIMGSWSQWLTLVMTVLGPEKGMEYLRQLAKNEPAFIKDVRLQAEWIAKGKYPIGIGVKADVATQFTEMGAPLKLFRISEGVQIAPGNGCFAIVTQAPHPNAAIVFANWLLSKEGQTVTVTAAKLPSARLDTTTEGLDPGILPIAGEKYFPADEDFFLVMPKVMEMGAQVFGSFLK